MAFQKSQKFLIVTNGLCCRI